MEPTSTSDGAAAPGRGPWTGRTLAGKYRIGELIGTGGLSEVYAAIQIDLDREVAVKVLAGDAAADARARFLHETRIAAGIRHPCVAQIFDAGVDGDGVRYLAMELLVGETLASRLARGPMAPTEAVAIVAGLCLALQAVHDKGFLHRDIKPSNVFLARRPDGGADPKLIDFGIAKPLALSEDVRRRVTMRGIGRPATALDIIVGTPRYMSPEQITGDPVDVRSDVYALAVTLYEMLAGAPPLLDDDLGELLAKIVVEEPPALAGVPPSLDREIQRALAKDPAARPESASAFAAALWTAMAEARQSPLPAAPVPPPRRRGVALAAALAATLAVVAVAISRRPSPSHAPPLPAPAAASVTAIAVAPPPSVPSPAPEATQGGSATAVLRPLAPASGRTPRPPSAPPPPASPSPRIAASAAPSRPAESFRLDDLKPAPF